MMYHSETCVLTIRSPFSVESVRLRFLTLVKGCTRLDQLSDHDIRSELGIYKLTEKIQKNKANRLLNAERMEDNRSSKCILDHKPIRRRDVRRPRKRWKDS
jgi:hypothetical protein